MNSVERRRPLEREKAIRAVREVRGEECALFVCRILDGRPKGKGILLELDRAGIRRDVIRFGGGGWHGGLCGFFSSFCAGRIDVDRVGTRDPFQFSLHPERIPVFGEKASPQTVCRQVSLAGGAARAANVRNNSLSRKKPYRLSHGASGLDEWVRRTRRNPRP